MAGDGCDDCGGHFHVRRINTPDGPKNLCYDCREAHEKPLRGPDP